MRQKPAGCNNSSNDGDFPYLGLDIRGDSQYTLQRQCARVCRFIISLVRLVTFDLLVVCALMKMAERPKFRNENKLTDEELLALLETDDYDSDFDDLALEGGSSDIEETDIVTETDEVDDVLQVSDTESENQPEDSSHVESDYPTYISKDGNVWAKVPFAARIKRRKWNIQKVPTGLTRYSSQFSTIKEAFELFFSQDILDVILSETNRKAESYYARNGKVFRPIVQEELEAFIGLLIIFGAWRSAREPICALWSQDPSLCRPIVSSAMSRNRFQQIMSFLRFDNFDTREERKRTDKFAPIRDVFDGFVSNCKKSLNPSEHLCVDEQLVPFRGKAPFRVYMKSKPDKYGLKIWALADCSSAYTANMQIYLGKLNHITKNIHIFIKIL